MFNLLGGRSGPSSKSDTTTPIRPVFSEHDVRELFTAFNLDETVQGNNGIAAPQRLIQSKSRDGLIQTQALVERIRTILEEGEGRVTPSWLADQCDVDEETIKLVLLQNGDWATLSADSSSVLTSHEQERLVSEIQSLASRQFLDSQDFSSKENVTTDNIQNLIKKGNLAVLSSDEATVSQRLDRPVSYIHDPAMLQKVTKIIIEEKTRAEKAKSLAVWTSENYFGLPLELFAKLVQQVILRLCNNTFENATASDAVSVRIDNQTVQYTPYSWLAKRRSDIMDRLVDGAESYTDLDHMVTAGVFPNADDAKEYIQANYPTRPGAGYPLLVISHYAVSSTKLDISCTEIVESLKLGQWVSIAPYVQAYPVDIRRDMHNEFSDLLATRSHVEGKKFEISGEYVVPQAWIETLVKKVQALMAEVAEHLWGTGRQGMPKPNAVRKAVVDRLDMLDDLCKTSYFDNMWSDEESMLYLSAIKTFNERWKALEINREEQFLSFWTPKVVDNTRLYAAGLEVLDDSPLKIQLTAAFQSYIKELVPQIIDKAEAKNPIKHRLPRIRDRTTELRNHLKASEGDSADAYARLEKTNEELGIAVYNEEKLKEKKQEHLMGMLRTMQKETRNSQEDDVRLFLNLLIILLAQEHRGVIWATGKLSPKLLKLLKQLNADLDPALTLLLEHMKEAITKGTVTDEMRGQMRRTAAESLGKVGQSAERRAL